MSQFRQMIYFPLIWTQIEFHFEKSFCWCIIDFRFIYHKNQHKNCYQTKRGHSIQDGRVFYFIRSKSCLTTKNLILYVCNSKVLSVVNEDFFLLVNLCSLLGIKPEIKEILMYKLYITSFWCYKAKIKIAGKF